MVSSSPFLTHPKHYPGRCVLLGGLTRLLINPRCAVSSARVLRVKISMNVKVKQSYVVCVVHTCWLSRYSCVFLLCIWRITIENSPNYKFLTFSFQTRDILRPQQCYFPHDVRETARSSIYRSSILSMQMLSNAYVCPGNRPISISCKLSSHYALVRGTMPRVAEDSRQDNSRQNILLKMQIISNT